MRNRFDRQMEELHTELIEMGALCEHVIGRKFSGSHERRYGGGLQDHRPGRGH